LLEKGVEHYWDMAINYAVVENWYINKYCIII
jgi:hypothetical protein